MSADGQGIVVCANPHCKIADGERCVEGLSPAECPNYGRPSADLDATTVALASITSGHPLPSADRLPIGECTRLLAKQESRVVAVIGPKGSGKTSLVAGLYDLFQVSDVGGVRFAGSATLHALELACHDMRAQSRREMPDTERTPLGEVAFYHLDLTSDNGRGGITLLIGDRAGEHYRDAIDDVDGVAFPEVQRADVVTLLVDGERLANTGARHNLRTEVTLIVQALLEGGFVSHQPHLIVVLTKADVVAAAESTDTITADFDRLAGRVEQIAGSSFSSITSLKVAASPRDSTTPRGLGLRDLLMAWLRPRTRFDTTLAETGLPLRMFQRFHLSSNSNA